MERFFIKLKVYEDPSEQFNRAADFPDMVTDLSDSIEQHRKTIVPVPSQLDSILH